MAVQSSHAAIVPNSQKAFIAFTGVACGKRGLAHHRRGLWQRRTQHQQHTTGIEDIAALLDPKCAHQADLFAGFGDNKAAARCTAAMISTWVPQRHKFPDKAALI